MGLYENINTKKIDIFSELFMTDNSSNKKNVENFQTESMVHKLKTIKKSKRMVRLIWSFRPHIIT